MARRPVFVVAVAGGSASGKTCFARDLAEALKPLDAAIVEEDAYYHPASVRGLGDVTTYNFDRPETKDFALLTQHLLKGQAGEVFHRPHYDFPTHDRTDVVTAIAPADVLIVEGLHNLTIAEIRALADLTVFVDAGYELITMGLAWWYRKYAREQSGNDAQRYEQAEQDAQAHRVGLWGDPQPTPPWEWRHPSRP